mmetsp:Transcript_28288/g.65171  ORF Transcript_28288/g.65171 Transcript_28288/m.65171 type:complete len:281 (+) Transcript_28288:1149-1991(+)
MPAAGPLLVLPTSSLSAPPPRLMVSPPSPTPAPASTSWPPAPMSSPPPSPPTPPLPSCRVPPWPPPRCPVLSRSTATPTLLIPRSRSRPRSSPMASPALLPACPPAPPTSSCSSPPSWRLPLPRSSPPLPRAKATCARPALWPTRTTSTTTQPHPVTSMPTPLAPTTPSSTPTPTPSLMVPTSTWSFSSGTQLPRSGSGGAIPSPRAVVRMSGPTDLRATTAGRPLATMVPAATRLRCLGLASRCKQADARRFVISSRSHSGPTRGKVFVARRASRRSDV